MKTSKAALELRVFAAPQKFEVRKNQDGAQTIAGQAVVYGAESQELGDGFIERIAPGAFSASLRSDDQLCLYSHDDARILGRKSAGTLTLNDSATALAFRCVLPNTSDGQTVAELCRRGDLRGMSFGMIVNDDDWTVDAIGRVIRTVKSASLLEVSPVGWPAYLQSTVSLRSCPATIREKLGRTQRDDYRPECDEESPDYNPDAICDDDDEDDARADALRVRQLFHSKRLNIAIK